MAARAATVPEPARLRPHVPATARAWQPQPQPVALPQPSRLRPRAPGAARACQPQLQPWQGVRPAPAGLRPRAQHAAAVCRPSACRGRWRRQRRRPSRRRGWGRQRTAGAGHLCSHCGGRAVAHGGGELEAARPRGMQPAWPGQHPPAGGWAVGGAAAACRAAPAASPALRRTGGALAVRQRAAGEGDAGGAAAGAGAGSQVGLVLMDAL